MGIIKRQGIKQSIVHYSATLIGAFSVIFIYPHSNGMYSLALFLTSAAALLAPFASLGANALTIRFFPKFRSEVHQHQGFLGIVLSYATISLLFFALLATLFDDFFVQLLQTARFKVELIKDYGFHAYLLAIILVWTNILTSYSSNFGRIATPTIFNSLIYKIALPILVVLFINAVIQEQAFAWGVITYHAIGIVGLIWFVWHLDEWKVRPNVHFLNPRLVKQMGIFAAFGILGSLGSTLTYQIDRVMVPTLMDLKKADVYNIALFVGASIEIPTRTIIAVTSPIIAQAWQDNNLQKIKELYNRSSINLFLIGLLLFLLVWSSIGDLFQLTGKYEILIVGQYVVFWVGVTKLFDMATSVNGQVIGYSRFFYFNLVAIVILGISNVGMNYYFIKYLEWGILGPAIASLISISIFNLVKVLFIWNQFQMQPFSWKNLVALAIGISSYWLVFMVPNIEYSVLNILKNSVLISVSYILPIYYLRLSEDFNELIQKGVHILLRRRII